MRRYRSLKHWGQDDLARAAGVKLTTLQAAEQGKNTPRYDTAKRYDDALEANGAILEAFGHMTVRTSVSSPSDDDDARHRVESLERDLARVQARLAEMETQGAEESESMNDSLQAMADQIRQSVASMDELTRRVSALERRR
jgi:transcriptional regulator with XRE-family HTH domain